MSENPWKAILAQLIAAAIPVIVKMLLDWIKDMSAEDAIAQGGKLGKFANAFKAELA